VAAVTPQHPATQGNHPDAREKVRLFVRAAVGLAAGHLCAGAGLGLCGVIMQSLLRNPLAEPYLL